jgi:hypothetical protein
VFVRILLVLAILIPYINGCRQSNNSVTEFSDEVQKIDACSVLIEALQSQNIPALESVQHWQNNYGPGLKLTTAHYEIFTTLLEPLMLRRIPGFIESAYQGYNSQLPQPVWTTSKFSVYLFDSREQWEDFTRTFAGEQAELFCKIKAGAYYLNGSCVLYNVGRKRTFSALGHEGWHQFNNRHFKFRLPSWLDEGVAMLFEAAICDDGMFHFEPAQNTYRLDSLKETIAKGKLIPLQELVAINPGEVLAIDQDEAVMAFYSQSYALVRFLREGRYGRYLSDFHRLLFDGLTGDWPLSDTSRQVAEDRNVPRTVQWNRLVGPQLFKYYIESDFDKIEKEYLTFCRKIITR